MSSLYKEDFFYIFFKEEARILKKKGVVITRFAFCIAVMISSPFVCAWAMKNMPSELVFAEKTPEEKGLTVSFIDEGMLSHGSPVDEREMTPEETADDTQAGPQPYPDSLEEHSGAICAMTYERQTGTQFFSLIGGAQVKNITSVPNGELMDEARELPEFKIEKNDEPQVLIMHTHTTESYEPYSREFYDDSFISRTTDESKNVVAVGEKIAAELESAGIGVIHDKTIHDYPSYNGSYDRSKVTVEKILAQYPSIKVVIDVHRDAIEYDDGTRIAPVAIIDGREAAQVMIISGCDDGTMNYPEYMKNFRFSCLWQRQLDADYKGLTRPILFTYKKYNQNLTTGSVLIEVGGHANSIDQALYSGELVGKSLAKALGSIQE